MPLYEYKCDVCGRIEEKFLPVERRNEEWLCPLNNIMTIKPHKIYYPGIKSFDNMTEEEKKEYEPSEPACKGKMKLQISKTSFKFHDPTELEAQYGRGGINDYE